MTPPSRPGRDALVAAVVASFVAAPRLTDSSSEPGSAEFPDRAGCAGEALAGRSTEPSERLGSSAEAAAEPTTSISPHPAAARPAATATRTTTRASRTDTRAAALRMPSAHVVEVAALTYTCTSVTSCTPLIQSPMWRLGGLPVVHLAHPRPS